MTDEDTLPETTLPNALSYEEILASADENFAFPDDIEEEAPAGMCYTSATTGNPKGVVYSHRGLVLHSMMLSMTDSMGIAERDVVMPIVPMFHANAWGLPFASVNVGATQVLPGPQFTSDLILDLVEQEKVTLTAGYRQFGLARYRNKKSVNEILVRCVQFVVEARLRQRALFAHLKKNTVFHILLCMG